MPGLGDAHGHVGSYGRSLARVACNGATSAAECARRAAEMAGRLPKGAWVRGRGWDQNLWPGGSFPTAAELTRAVHARDEFLAIAAHELRNPMTPILGYVEHILAVGRRPEIEPPAAG